jgi:RNA polymerase sigma-70 factor, ECF subfamily
MELVGVSNNDELVDLVSRLVSGDSASEEEIIRRYKGGIRFVIDQIVRNEFVTADLCQDTFATVITKIRRGDLREPERLSGFVCSVARNLAIAYIRVNRREVKHQTISEIEQISDTDPNPLERVLTQEKAAVVRKVINELPNERDRELLLRYYIAEEDKDRICAQLQLSRLQFNSVLFRAKKRFKELYLKIK